MAYNYRMTDMQAALGVSQLERLDAYVTRRHQLAQRYNDLLAGMPLTTPWQHPDELLGLHLYVIRLHLNKLRRSHREVFEALRAAGIGVNLHYIPVHTQPYYRQLGFQRTAIFPRRSVTTPRPSACRCIPTLSEAEQDRVVAALREALA